MSNAFFTASGQPATGAFAASAPMRTEFQSIQAGFDKLPLLTANTAVVVNGAGTALANTVGTLALAGNFATTGAFSTTLVASANVSITLPGVSATLLYSGGPLGTPSSGVATNLTGTASGLTAGTVTTNANLTGPITSIGNTTSVGSQTGSGSIFVMNTSPTLVTPVLGVATATSINKVALTAPATSATLTIADGKTLTASASLTLAGADSTTMTFPGTSATIARTDAANTFTGVQTFSTPIATGSVATMTATVGGGVPTPPNNTTTFLRGDGTFASAVTTVSVATANGFAGTVANATTTPAITITTSINAPVLAGNGTAILAATTTGSGSTVVLATGATLVTPAIGVATATSLAIGGATIGSNALAVTGNVTISGAITSTSGSVSAGGGYFIVPGSAAFGSAHTNTWQMTNTATDAGVLFNVGTDAVLRLQNLAQNADASLIVLGVTISSGAQMLTSNVAMTNGAAVATGTLTNAPTAGNPTKWIPFNDNGTTRYIPSW